MTPYLLYITLTLSLFIANDIGILKKEGGYFFRFFTSISLILLAALRSPDVGKDIPNYLESYQFVSNNSWNEIFQLRFEPGYIILTKALSIISTDPVFFILSTSIISLLGPVYFVSKFSKNLFISYFFYMTMAFFAFSISGIRQSIATSILLIGYNFLVKRKLIPFLILTLLASTFHTVAVAWVLVYFVSSLKFNSKSFIYLSLVFVIVFLFKGNLIQYIVTNHLEQYEEMLSKSESYTFLITMVALMLAGLFLYRGNIDSNQSAKILFSLVYLASLSQIFGSESSNAARLSILFYTAVIVFIPEFIESRGLGFIRYGAYIFLFFATLIQFIVIFPGGGYGSLPYKFSF